MLPEAKSSRILSDFTGDSYRLVFEEGYDSLADYEKSLAEIKGKDDPIAPDSYRDGWKKWYEKFKQHVFITPGDMKQVM